MSQEAGVLSEEARYFHLALFQSEPEPEVVERYVSANQFCFPAIDPKAYQTVATILSHHLDLEAVEVALRLRGRGTILTKKIQILLYLLEVRSRYYDCFINQRPQFRRASIAVLLSLSTTAWKLVKGSFLIWRYGLT
jgi:hypothetical protein